MQDLTKMSNEQLWVRRFLPYLAKYKKTLFIDLFCAAMTTLCDIIRIALRRK